MKNFGPFVTAALALILSPTMSPRAHAAAGDSSFKLSGSLHGKTELITYLPSYSWFGFLSQGQNYYPSNTLTNMEGFLKGSTTFNSQTSMGFRLPVGGIPYLKTRTDLVQAWANWKSADQFWEIDMGRFGTRHSLENDELAETAFSTHGLLWRETEVYSDGTYSLPSMTAPRGHLGLRLSANWSQSFRTEFLYSAPEALMSLAYPSIETGIRLEYRSSPDTLLTLGYLESAGYYLQSKTLYHLGAKFQAGATQLTTEAQWCSERPRGLERTEYTGLAIRTNTPLTDSLGIAFRAEYTSDFQYLLTAALNHQVSKGFDIRYQLTGNNLDPEDLERAEIELGISGSFRF